MGKKKDNYKLSKATKEQVKKQMRYDKDVRDFNKLAVKLGRPTIELGQEPEPTHDNAGYHGFEASRETI